MDTRYVAALARLQLSAAEIERFTQQLNSILDHVADLEEVDATAPPGAVLPGEAAAPLREDEPGADPLALPPVALAPAFADGFFTVPRLAALDADGES